MKDLKNKLKDYLNNNLSQDNQNKKELFKAKNLFIEEYYDSSLENENTFYKVNTYNSNIKDFIDKHEEYNDFQTMLFKLIDDRNLKDSDVYNKVHIDRRLFSKIRSDKNYHPSKETIILLGIALELTENELDDLLESASYSLPKNNEYDLIIRFCFINKIFKITSINELLYEYNCKLFNY